MRLKLITVYLLILVSLTLVGYISFHGLSMLMDAMRSALQPDEREEKFENILDMTLEAENNIRMFTITQDPQFLQPYRNSVENLQSYIDNLYIESMTDSFLTRSLDSIYDLVRDKIYYQEELIRLKQKDLYPDLFSEVLTEIDSIESRINKPDTIRIVQRHNLTDQEPEADETESEEETKKRSFFSIFSRIFGAKKEDQKEIPAPEKQAETFAEPDTLTEIFDKSVEISGPIEQRIRQIKQREKFLQQQITASELNLTRKDDALTLKLASILDQVGLYLDRRSMEKADTAKKFLTNTTRYITITGTVASMLLLFLIFIVMKDFQLIIKTKKQLELAKNKAEKLASIKEEFLANMSHEIRTPLNAIIGFTRHIEKANLPGHEQKYLDIINHSSAHLLNIINEILDFSKLEAGKMALEKVSVETGELIRQVAISFEQEALEKNLEIRLSIDRKLDHLYIFADPHRLRQILINLISNAIKFTPQGFIEIKAALTEKDYLILEVSDTGIGINQESIAQIFEKFNQADKSTSRKYGGTGLGLSIVKKLVDLHNGTLKVNSAPGKGSSFVIEMPVKIKEKSEEDGRKSEKDTIDFKQAKILVADDDPYNLMLLEKMLKDQNAKVFSVSSGKAVLDLIDNTAFDLILLDIQMPEMDGYEVAHKIRIGKKYSAPVYALTAHVNEKVTMRSKEAGIDKVFAKPVDEKILIKELAAGILKKDKDTYNDSETGEKTERSKVNLSHLNQMAENDPKFIEKMTGMYIKNLEDAIQQIKKSDEINNLEHIQYTAHKLIPSTRHMGFDRTVILFKSIEEMDTEKLNQEEKIKIKNDFLKQAEDILDKVKIKYEQILDKKI